jgi:transcriptional regulator with XRE-family HTH domain
MKRTAAHAALPLSITRALTKLGDDLSNARKRRRITMAAMAERAFVTRQTIARVERGDPKVSMGIYATVMFVLGMTDRLAALADANVDRLGAILDAEQLPKRVRTPRNAP